VPTQHPAGIADVLTELVSERCASHVATLLLSPFDAPKGTQGGVASLLSRHASRDIGFDSTLKMVSELILKILLNLIAAEQRPNPQPPRVEQT
jgi:hypothetical protein